MPTQKRQDRITKILAALQQTHESSFRELSLLLGVSEMTVRRDLELLSNERKVRLVHAGAILSGRESATLAAYTLPPDFATAGGEKARIGKKAASLLEPGDVIIIDAGSTTEWMARSLPPSLPLTVLCYALNILVAVSGDEKRRVVFAGGALRNDTLVFESPEGVSLLRRYRANKAFLSAGGLSDTLGVTCEDPVEAELKKAAVASSQTRILLVDSRKFAAVKPSWFAELRDFHAVITDTGVALEYVEILRNLGIALHVV
jgi:DeoR family transcriptional regulator, deoxyribose operon repressor